jgi:hypothetical protein
MTAGRVDPGVADELAQADADVQRARERVASSVEALQDEVARQVDRRRWLSRHPLMFLSGAFAVGFWLGARRHSHYELGDRR